MMHRLRFHETINEAQVPPTEKISFIFILFFYKAELSASLLQSSVHDPSEIIIMIYY